MDEAGRGAVLGPLVVAGVVSAEEKIWPQKIRNSKALPRQRRKEILRELFRQGLRGKALVIPPEVIDQKNLTALELWAMAELIQSLRPDKVVLDPPVGPKAIPKFVGALSSQAGFPGPIVAFPKADERDPVVAAASILAKVVRDGYVLFLHKKFGDFGWGYPSEAKVREYLGKFVSKHGDWPPICRRRWRTVSREVALGAVIWDNCRQSERGSHA